jgi:E3 ubiquitin-protein ligase makorin
VNKNGVKESSWDGDDECCICMEKVLASGKQFGILDGCDHTFCLNCIRGWRSTYDKKSGSKHHYRTCPICRRNSYLVIPSDHVIKNGPEKDDIVEEYKEVIS